MSKMGLHDPFEHLKHKLWPKERSGVKLTIWFPTTKSRESLRFPCVQVACYIPLQNLNEGYNFSSNLISIGGLHTKLWAPKIAGIPTLGISGFPVGRPRTKRFLGASPVARHRVYYKGEGGGFPQVRAVVSLVSLVSPWLPVVRPCSKVLQVCTN
jgi:hypothetical protein